MIKIKRALISVSDKTGIVDFALELHNLGVEILSTGKTARVLQAAKIPVIEVSDYTGFPEMLDGRVKTLLNYNLVSIKPIFFVDKNENKPMQEIIFESYYAFGMFCFITGAKDKELKAWPIKKGATAYEAAGAIHSAIQQKFIKAEIISYDDVVKAGGLIQAKQYMRLEGKDYLMQDGDLLNVRT